MSKKKKKLIFGLIVAIAFIILISVGSTFAYFSATIGSEENAVGIGSATFEIDLIDDTSLLKSNLIPSAVKYVDIASTRYDETTGDFIKPYEKDGKLITENTACIDDNLNEICSIYTFTVQNPMTDLELPLSIMLVPSINTFTNLYFKVLDENMKVVVNDTPIVDSRYELDPVTGEYRLDAEGNKIPKENFASLTPLPIPLKGIDTVLPKAESPSKPSEATFSIVIWIMETGKDQTRSDSDQVFAGGIHVTTTDTSGTGITGIFSAGGVE